jgi:hypothetical protein
MWVRINIEVLIISCRSQVSCSRWTELAESLRFHATVAEKLGAPTEFRFLNGSPPIVVGRKDDNGNNLAQLLSALNQVMQMNGVFKRQF